MYRFFKKVIYQLAIAFTITLAVYQAWVIWHTSGRHSV